MPLRCFNLLYHKHALSKKAFLSEKLGLEYIYLLLISNSLCNLNVILLLLCTTVLLTNSIYISSFHSESPSSNRFKFAIKDLRFKHKGY